MTSIEQKHDIHRPEATPDEELPEDFWLPPMSKEVDNPRYEGGRGPGC